MQIQSLCKQMGTSACLAFTYARIATDGYGGTEYDRTMHIIKKTIRAQGAELLDKEFFVNNASAFISFVNPLVKAEIEKRKIKSLSEVKEYEYVCVNFAYKGKNHWVWVKYGKLYWDSLDYSVCVAMGEPVDARIVKIKEAA